VAVIKARDNLIKRNFMPHETMGYCDCDLRLGVLLRGIIVAVYAGRGRLFLRENHTVDNVYSSTLT